MAPARAKIVEEMLVQVATQHAAGGGAKIRFHIAQVAAVEVEQPDAAHEQHQRPSPSPPQVGERIKEATQSQRTGARPAGHKPPRQPSKSQ